MLPPTHLRNVNNASLDATESRSSNMRRTLCPASTSNSFRLDPFPFDPSNLFNRSDQPPSDSEKTDKKPVGEFLWCGICQRIDIKNFSPDQASLCKYI